MKHALLVVDLTSLREPNKREYRALAPNIEQLKEGTERLGEACWLIPVSSNFDDVYKLLTPVEQLGLGYRIAFYDDPIQVFEKK